MILSAIEAHIERWIRFTQTVFVCLAKALPYTRSVWVCSQESQRKCIIKCPSLVPRPWYLHNAQASGRSRAHLAESTDMSEICQMIESCLFHYGPLWQSVWLHHSHNTNGYLACHWISFLQLPLVHFQHCLKLITRVSKLVLCPDYFSPRGENSLVN